MRPILSRILCAAAALADVSASELAARAGMPVARVSQLRSGAQGDAAAIERLLRIVGATPETLIQRLGDVDDWATRDVEDLLCALLLSFDRRSPSLGTAPPRIACDRLALTLRPTSNGEALIEDFFANAKPLPTDGNYKRAGKYRRVWLGSGLKWLRGAGARIDFNPAHVGPPGMRIVAAIVAASRDVRLTRVDVAVDLQTSLLDVQPLGTQQRKVTGIWNGSRVETIYIGSEAAKLSFAVYDRASKLLRLDRREAKVVRPIEGDLTRFEARLKKRRLVPAELPSLGNPFRELRLLWLDGSGLSFIDRLLLRLAQVDGFAFVERQIPPRRRERLRERFHSAATEVGVAHPRDVYEASWRTEAERVLAGLGLENA